MNIVRGRIWKFGDNINTDNLSPGYYIANGISELARHCLEAVRPEFPQNVKKGDVILAGYNFGTGSSRETAPATLKALGVALVIAGSFARIFYRNAINIALPLLECAEIFNETKDGDMVAADLSTGTITNETLKESFRSVPLPKIMMDILQAGGLINYAIKEKW